MDSARNAERRRKLWLVLGATGTLILLFVAAILIIAFGWDNEDAKREQHKFVLASYNKEGKYENIETESENFYDAVTKNVKLIFSESTPRDAYFRDFVATFSPKFADALTKLDEEEETSENDGKMNGADHPKASNGEATESKMPSRPDADDTKHAKSADSKPTNGKDDDGDKPPTSACSSSKDGTDVKLDAKGATDGQELKDPAKLNDELSSPPSTPSSAFASDGKARDLDTSQMTEKESLPENDSKPKEANQETDDSQKTTLVGGDKLSAQSQTNDSSNTNLRSGPKEATP